MQRGVFLDVQSVDRGELDLSTLRQTLPDWVFHPRTRAVDTASRIASAAVVITNKVVIDGAMMAQATQLRLICVAATGTNNIDLEAARQRGIVVCNVAGYATPSVTEHVFALLLSLSRQLPDYSRAALDGRWQRSEQFCVLERPIRELAGRTLGIVGYGELGRSVAQLATAFGMQVRVAARPGTPSSPGRLPLDELLPQVDALSLHCPLTEQTRGLIGAPQLARMRRGAWLINTARGGIVDEPALIAALSSGQLGGAAVDVLTAEPPTAGHPLLDASIPNLIVTPHVAWASVEARQRLIDEMAANIRAWQHGSPRNRVA